MAYRRKRTYRRKKRAFSKKQVKAIKAISQVPVETKHFPYTSTFAALLNAGGYINGPSGIVFNNIYSTIPRADNTLTRDEYTFDGNEIQSRGFRFELNAYTVAATPGASLDVQFRFTVFSMAAFFSGIAGIGPSDPAFFDTDHDTTPTWSKWNTQNVTIHLQKTFRIDNNGNLNGLVRRKFYVPLRRKITSTLDASLVANSFMGEIKNKQVYWALEFFTPGFAVAADLRGYITGGISTGVYFKDA